jgi:predicted nucleic acid-binding protein
MILCDTNILIEFYKDNPIVKTVLRRLGVSNLAVSVITIGELYYGARDKRELRKIQRHLALLTRLSTTIEVSAIFIDLLEEYVLSHRLSIPDALIAATALANNLSLYT